MASTSVDGTMYNVAPTSADLPLSAPVLVNSTTTLTAPANGTPSIVASATLPAGTYLVGGTFQASATTGNAWASTDYFIWRIRDTAGALTTYPQQMVTGPMTYLVSTNYFAGTSLTGVITLATAGTITWDVNIYEISATGKTFTLNNGWYQRIA